MADRRQITGIVLIVLGLLFVFGGGINIGEVAWPLFVIIPGLVLLTIAFMGKREAAGLAIPGSIVTTIGLILLVLNITDYWQAWSYCWALIVAGAGFGNFIHGALTKNPDKERDGLKAVYTGLVMFAAFGAFFEFIIWGSIGPLLRWVLPLALVAAGVYLLLRNQQSRA